jgi:hypothetical protein
METKNDIKKQLAFILKLYKFVISKSEDENEIETITEEFAELLDTLGVHTTNVTNNYTTNYQQQPPQKLDVWYDTKTTFTDPFFLKPDKVTCEEENKKYDYEINL